MKLNNLFVFTFLILLFSCSCEESIINKKVGFKSDSTFLLSDVTEAEIEEIASNHNNALSCYFNNFNYSSSDLGEELSQRIESCVSSFGIFSASEIDNLTELKSIADTISIQYRLGSEYSYIEQIDSQDLDDIMNLELLVNSIIVDAENNVSDLDKVNIIRTYGKVYIASAQFWTSSEGVTILANANEANGQTFKTAGSDGKYATLKKVLAGDATGAAGALIGGALFANADAVIAPPVFFGRVAFSAAWASGAAALF